MTVTYSPAQTAGVAVTTVDTSVSSPQASSLIPTGCLFRFSLSANLYLFNPIYLNVSLDSISGSEEFFVLVVSDGDAFTTLSNGALAASLVPSAYSSVHGTAESYELARETFTTSGSKSIELDAALLTRFMSSSTAPTSAWNGSLVLWLCASQTSFGAWSNATLTAYNSIDYANRDTGGPGRKSSRYSRCPVSGIKVPRGEMVLDGYRGILVHPDAYDPPEPEPREWGDDSTGDNEDL